MITTHSLQRLDILWTITSLRWNICCYVHCSLLAHKFHIYPYIWIDRFENHTTLQLLLVRHKRNMFLHIRCVFFSLLPVLLLICFLLSFRKIRLKRILPFYLQKNPLLYRNRWLPSPIVQALKQVKWFVLFSFKSSCAENNRRLFVDFIISETLHHIWCITKQSRILRLCFAQLNKIVYAVFAVAAVIIFYRIIHNI